MAVSVTAAGPRERKLLKVLKQSKGNYNHSLDGPQVNLALRAAECGVTP